MVHSQLLEAAAQATIQSSRDAIVLYGFTCSVAECAPLHIEVTLTTRTPSETTLFGEHFKRICLHCMGVLLHNPSRYEICTSCTTKPCAFHEITYNSPNEIGKGKRKEMKGDCSIPQIPLWMSFHSSSFSSSVVFLFFSVCFFFCRLLSSSFFTKTKNNNPLRPNSKAPPYCYNNNNNTPHMLL